MNLRQIPADPRADLRAVFHRISIDAARLQHVADEMSIEIADGVVDGDGVVHGFRPRGGN